MAGATALLDSTSMPMFDLPLSDLISYRPEVAEPTDFDDFWTATMTETAKFELAASWTRVDNKLAVIDTYDVSYSGFGGSPVKAWLHVPAGASGPLPTVVEYHGYSRGRGFPHSSTQWAQAGYAHFVMDTRGQGWRSGGGSSTVDASVDAASILDLSFVPGGHLDMPK